jgi:hypothetical protein
MAVVLVQFQDMIAVATWLLETVGRGGGAAHLEEDDAPITKTTAIVTAAEVVRHPEPGSFSRRT